eukprot:CAMPEP_0194069846 /NCGR_PEP_ID=MMETSP0009_2-20130614/87862_1 /TAXON_ID=210454 /ORGANISM="Grammatophora oceanica, Strain CCMP 410" /LENGTH=89 /DNA_ID=CAMNT_0038723069 /DNA_START=1320 /DNA_END=1589 /DNA_ORIENTATION=-
MEAKSHGPARSVDFMADVDSFCDGFAVEFEDVNSVLFSPGSSVTATVVLSRSSLDPPESGASVTVTSMKFGGFIGTTLYVPTGRSENTY